MVQFSLFYHSGFGFRCRGNSYEVRVHLSGGSNVQGLGFRVWGLGFRV